MMKTIPKREFDQFLEVLPQYYEMIRQNPNSLVSRFYGLHRVKWQHHKGTARISYLVVMNNVFKDFNVGIRFDLKGSIAGRTLLEHGQDPYDK